jgi:hypothetical protein
MKKLIVAILSITIMQNIQSQEIVNPDYIWSNLEEHCHVWGSSYTTKFFNFNGDTIVNDTLYKKIWISEDENHTTWDFYFALIREENNRVYYRPAYGQEGLIYDFNLELGDSVLVDNSRAVEPVWLTLSNVDTIETEIGQRERWYMESSLYPEVDYWIRGIGSESGILNSSTSVFGGLCGLYELLCQEETDYIVYQNPEYQTCYLYTVGAEEKTPELFSANYKPSQQVLLVELKSEDVHNLILSDIRGNILYRKETSLKRETIPFERIPSGLYILTISSKDGYSVYKFVK